MLKKDDEGEGGSQKMTMGDRGGGYGGGSIP